MSFSSHMGAEASSHEFRIPSLRYPEPWNNPTPTLPGGDQGPAAPKKQSPRLLENSHLPGNLPPPSALTNLLPMGTGWHNQQPNQLPEAATQDTTHTSSQHLAPATPPPGWPSTSPGVPPQGHPLGHWGQNKRKVKALPKWQRAPKCSRWQAEPSWGRPSL